jgi:hypothetical protein
MVEPVRVSDAIQDVLARLKASGIILRTREQRLADVMKMIRREFPSAREYDLEGDLSEFALAERRDEACRFYKQNGRCPGACGVEGKLWYVDQRDTRTGPRYYVTFRTCGLWWRWKCEQAAQSKEKQAKQQMASSFSMR